MPFTSIVMPYKENCKAEGEILTKFKIARMYFSDGETQKDIAANIKCHGNTVNKIIKKCNDNISADAKEYLITNKNISLENLNSLFKFFEYQSRAPASNKNSLPDDEEKIILKKFEDKNYGPKRIFKHLKTQKYDVENIYTLGKIKGVCKRNKIKCKKIRTANGERRSLYNYGEIGAFEYLQYDTKKITDKHALPLEIYSKFKKKNYLPEYQWTIIDAKTKTKFLAWSYSLSSFFGLKFLEFTVSWIRSHGIDTKINVQFDGGSEFCSMSERKVKDWNEKLKEYNVKVYDTGGVKWKQNLVERTHRTDDEEFYCPRGELINTKGDFILEGQKWIIAYNHRSHGGIGMDDKSPKEKLESLGVFNAEEICNFPCLILEDFFDTFRTSFMISIPKKNLCLNSQNVLTPYPIHSSGSYAN